MGKVYEIRGCDDWMSAEERERIGCLHLAISALLFVLVALLCVVFGGCRSVEYVSVPEVRTDTVLISKSQRDSIWLHDSVWVSEKVKGDTVYVALEKWHTKYVEKFRTDTLYEHRTDSVGVPYPVEVKVERALSWWQKVRMWIGSAVLGVLGVIGVMGVLRVMGKL